jgi:hypothetical protein
MTQKSRKTKAVKSYSCDTQKIGNCMNTPSSRSKTVQRNREKPNKGHLTLPYVEGVTEAISRKMRNFGITVHVKPTNTIRSKLVAPKDKIPFLDKTGTIYRIQCNDCQSQYIGETERPLKKRLQEHTRESSPVAAHMKDRDHQFDLKNVSIMSTDTQWFERGVKESIFIAAARPDLNRDLGRHHLPAAYNSLIRSHDLGCNPLSCD